MTTTKIEDLLADLDSQLDEIGNNISTLESELDAAKDYASSAESAAADAWSVVNDAQGSWENINHAHSELLGVAQQLRAQLEESSPEAAQSSLARDIAAHKTNVAKQLKAGYTPDQVAKKLNISVTLVGLIHQQLS